MSFEFSSVLSNLASSRQLQTSSSIGRPSRLGFSSAAILAPAKRALSKSQELIKTFKTPVLRSSSPAILAPRNASSQKTQRQSLIKSLVKSTSFETENLPEPIQAIEHYQARMKKIGLSAPHQLIPEKDWPQTYPEATNNKEKNRYENVLPTGLDLVYVLNPITQMSSYVNASRFFEQMIVTQGPLEGTLIDFWILALGNATDIVCLTDAKVFDQFGGFIEKTYPYWLPVSAKSNIVFEKKLSDREILQVRLVEDPITVIPVSDNSELVSKRVFEISLGDRRKTVAHWFYEKWEDHGVCDPTKLAHLIRLLIAQPDVSLLVHCSAGIGRAAVFAIARKCIENHLRTGIYPTEEQIDQAVIDLRLRRPTSVQGSKQLKLISDVIYAFMKKRKAVILQ
jgi:protein tyrosine phosphatase